MPLSPHANLIYQYLRTQVVPHRRICTYEDVHRATGVEYGVEGGYIGRLLGEIFEQCDTRHLPPITSVVVRVGELQSELYDRSCLHGMPGPGYFKAEALSPNRARRRRDAGIEIFAQTPQPAGFDKETERWRFQDMIEAHQDSVWRARIWPEAL